MNHRIVRRAALLATVLLAVPAAAQAAPPFTSYPCHDAQGFTCHRMDVPLDRTGTVPGTLSLRFATETGQKLKKNVLVALAGGPGQPDVAFGPSFADGFSRELSDYSLVVVDQRGTGGSRALSCPELQGMDQLTAVLPQDTAACADRLGLQRDSFGSIETADDLEAVRQALGVDKLSIYGVSYGTWVAQQYARTHPDHTGRLILDSVVPPGADPWDLRITESLPRVLRGLCDRGQCRGITPDIVGDLATVAHRIQAAGGKLTTTVISPTGGRVHEKLTQVDVLYILVNSDLNTYMQSRVPAALAAAAQGDLAPLARLKRDTAGPVSPLSQFSSALFVATTCLDNDLPFSYSDPFDVRAQKAKAALDALPESTFAPFDRPTIDSSSVPQICLQWPDGKFRPESTAPMPDVPALILSGLADIRTSTEGARELAKELPHSTLVTLRGSGHDVFDSDFTGCADEAVARFLAGRTVGQPCRKADVSRPRTRIPPRSLAATPIIPGLPTMESRLVRAAYWTVADTSDSDFEAYYAGFNDSSGGGLRGGRFDSIPTGNGQLLVLHRMVYVPRVRVSGSVITGSGGAGGSVKVTGPFGLSGRVRFLGHRLVARIGKHTLKATFAEINRTRFGSSGTRVSPVLRLVTR